MFLIPPPGLVRKKGIAPIELIDANSIVNGPTSPFLALSNIQAGDIIVGAGAKSGSGSGVQPTMTGFTYLFGNVWTAIVQNTFRSGYKVAVGGETGIQFGFGNTSTWCVGAVFRNAAAAVNNQSTNGGTVTTIFPLGSHTESDDTSMSVLFGWMNVNSTFNPGSITEPSGYSLTARALGSDAGGSFQDRILSLWHRPYANLGGQNPQWVKSNFDSSDYAYTNAKLTI